MLLKLVTRCLGWEFYVKFHISLLGLLISQISFQKMNECVCARDDQSRFERHFYVFKWGPHAIWTLKANTHTRRYVRSSTHTHTFHFNKRKWQNKLLPTVFRYNILSNKRTGTTRCGRGRFEELLSITWHDFYDKGVCVCVCKGHFWI